MAPSEAAPSGLPTAQWELLQKVKQDNKVVGEAAYQALLKSLFVFEYRDGDGTWSGLNPILAEMKLLK